MDILHEFQDTKVEALAEEMRALIAERLERCTKEEARQFWHAVGLAYVMAPEEAEPREDG